MSRLARIALTLALGFSLAITSQYLSFVEFQFYLYESEGLPKVITGLARLQTALALITFASLASVFLPHYKEQN